MITQKVQAFAQSATRWWQSWLDIWRFIQMKSHLLATCVTTNQIKPVIWRHTWIICILNKLPFKTNINLVKTSLKYNCFRAILAKLGNQESVQFITRWCQRVYIHMRIDYDEKPFACHLCDYRSNQSSNLNSHIQRRHNRLPW